MALTKKSWRLALVLAGALTLAACGSDDTASDEGASGYTYEPAPQQQTQNGGDVSSQNLGYDQQGAQSSPTQQGLQAEAGDRIFFGYDSHDLDSRAQSVLRAQAVWMTRWPSVTVTIEGHCDERGTREYNLALGDRRANAVKSYLVSLGVPASRINTVSYGKERPAAPCSSEQCWAQNRRGVMMVNGY